MNHIAKERPDKIKNGLLPTYVQGSLLLNLEGHPLGQPPPATVVLPIGRLPAGTGPIEPLAGNLDGIKQQSPLTLGTKVGALLVRTGNLLDDPRILQLTPLLEHGLLSNHFSLFGPLVKNAHKTAENRSSSTSNRL